MKGLVDEQTVFRLKNKQFEKTNFSTEYRKTISDNSKKW